LTVTVVSLHDKDEIESFARGDPFVHIYELGDLDEFFWDRTVWYAHKQGDGQLRALALLYLDQSLPVFLANSRDPKAVRDLVRAVMPLLPGRLYAHLSQGAVAELQERYHIEPRGTHHKMGLLGTSRLETFDTSEVMTLSPADVDDLSALYRAAYPRNWFVPRMLETALYQGIRRDGRLVSVAGVHVHSAHYRVAALGNVATHPVWRGQGLGTLVSAKVCQELLRRGVEQIGLNVHADNSVAVACYEKLGFRRVVDYGEFHLESR
jgi:GNAT superfamily N-acetyltransferase